MAGPPSPIDHPAPDRQKNQAYSIADVFEGVKPCFLPQPLAYRKHTGQKEEQECQEQEIAAGYADHGAVIDQDEEHYADRQNTRNDFVFLKHFDRNLIFGITRFKSKL
jgi:hypothetical protein